MVILELTNEECVEMLTRLKFGRLGCSRGDQPYVVPFNFAYNERHLYSFATLGQKIEWMRTNPLVCVEADDIADRSDWTSVVVLGRYEVPDAPGGWNVNWRTRCSSGPRGGVSREEGHRCPGQVIRCTTAFIDR
jgi:nitroimidazol reductase NimA-like FMN-containing flavoprotein (pyridoxamine 5'-phosphate oxidase superfamily)